MRLLKRRAVQCGSTCRLELASDSLDLVALVAGMLDVTFDVEPPPELAQHLRKLADRFTAAAEQR